MIIGIGGVSNSGKSALAKLIMDSFDSGKAVVICQDDFTLPIDKIRKTGDHIDWESPQSVDFKRYQETLKEASSRYEVVIAEGLMAFHSSELFDIYDKKIYVTISKSEFVKRKRNDLRWGKEPEWYIEHIWESFLKYGQPKNESDIMIIDGEKTIELPAVLNFLST